MENPLRLECKKISKSFSSVQVLKQIDLQVKRGSVHALMGENGAGKSTLMKILAGIYSKDEGEIEMDGEPVHISTAMDAIELGIAMIHQELSVLLDMSVADNIYLNKEKVRGPLKTLDRKQMNQDVSIMLKEIGLDVDPNRMMRSLSVAQRQMVEIAKAISRDSKIIVMDEPTTAITDREVEKLFELIRQLTAQGKSIIYISHKMDEIFRIADTITVLRDGAMISSGSVSSFTPDSLIAYMVGRELTDVYPKETHQTDQVVLSVKGLSTPKRFSNISFDLHKGEILGFAGLVGSGRTEVAEALFGMFPATSGEILVHGKPASIKSPADAIRNKMAFISEDRKFIGLNLIGSVKDNTTLANLKEYCKMGVIDRKLELKTTAEYVQMFNVKTHSLHTEVKYLSGGNQQKVILAKWISCEPDIIIMDEPTKGIDVGAKSEIYRVMRELTRAGKSILMISSELPEALGMSDRICVFSNREIAGIFPTDTLDQEKIMYYASGQHRKEQSA